MERNTADYLFVQAPMQKAFLIGCSPLLSAQEKAPVLLCTKARVYVSDKNLSVHLRREATDASELLKFKANVYIEIVCNLADADYRCRH